MLLIQFVGLQIADALTTLVFLQRGVGEANPLIRVALAMFGQPALGLAIAKALGIGVALVAWRTGRCGMLRKINLLFAACVAWNLLAIALSPATALAG
jgi:hypothetical protein